MCVLFLQDPSMPAKPEWSDDDHRLLRHQFKTSFAKKTLPSETDVQKQLRKSVELQDVALSKICHHTLRGRSREAVIVAELKKMLKETQRRSNKLKKARESKKAKSSGNVKKHEAVEPATDADESLTLQEDDAVMEEQTADDRKVEPEKPGENASDEGTICEDETAEETKGQNTSESVTGNTAPAKLSDGDSDELQAPVTAAQWTETAQSDQEEGKNMEVDYSEKPKNMENEEEEVVGKEIAKPQVAADDTEKEAEVARTEAGEEVKDVAKQENICTDTNDNKEVALM